MRSKHFRLVLLLTLLAITLLLREGVFIPNAPSKSTFPTRGIDVSHHNGSIEWAKVAAAKIRFAFIKATEGSDIQDNHFARNWQDAQNNGIVVGAYHFFSTLSPGAAQADNFIRTVPITPGMLPPVIDLEFPRIASQMSDQDFHQNFQELVARLQNHYRVRPIVYTTRQFHHDYFPGKVIDPLWVRAVIWRPYKLANNWTFWQFSSLGRIPGIHGRVDLNVFKGRYGDLPRLTHKSEQSGGGRR